MTLLEQNRPQPKHLSILENNNTNLNLNIASYFLNILASPGVLTRFATGDPRKKTIKHLGLTKHNRNIVERKLHIINWCKYMELQYIGKIL